MPYKIRRQGRKFCVYGPSGSHGCHSTRAEARQQQKALYANERRAHVRYAVDTTGAPLGGG